jgi:hypothetical protein
MVTVSLDWSFFLHEFSSLAIGRFQRYDRNSLVLEQTDRPPVKYCLPRWLDGRSSFCAYMALPAHCLAFDRPLLYVCSWPRNVGRLPPPHVPKQKSSA